MASPQDLLAQLRRGFVNELTERIDAIEDRVVRFEKAAADEELFNELYRMVHSLKGSGGTYGFPILSDICHALENRLNAHLDGNGASSRANINRWFEYLDLLRMAHRFIQNDATDFAEVTAALEKLSGLERQGGLSVLIAANSGSLQAILKGVWSDAATLMECHDNGLIALERALRAHWDVLICSRELPVLSGDGLIAAVRLSNGPSREATTILVTSDQFKGRCEAIDPDHVLLRNTQIIPRMTSLVDELLAIKSK